MDPVNIVDNRNPLSVKRILFFQDDHKLRKLIITSYNFKSNSYYEEQDKKEYNQSFIQKIFKK